MNSKGIFSFIIVIGFSALLLELISANSENNAKFRETKNSLIEAEKLNTQRTIIEENIDYLIKQKLEEQLKKTNSGKTIKAEINKTLLQYFQETEKENTKNPKIEFLTKKGEKISFEYLQGISKADVQDFEQIKIYGLYTITGGISAREKIMGKITGENAELYFELPIGHTTLVWMGK